MKTLPAVLLLTSLSVACSSIPAGRDLAGEYAALGDAYFELGRFDMALALYERARLADPTYPTADFSVARALAALGRHEDAAVVLHAILDHKPDNLVVISTLAYVEGRRGRLDRALELYAAVLDSSPRNINALYNSALIHRARGDAEQAERFLETAYRAAPDDPLIAREYGRQLVMAGKTGDALHVLEMYSERNPADIDTLRVLAGLYMREELFAHALRAYERLSESEAAIPEDFYHLALVSLSAAGEREIGLDALRAALQRGYRDKERLSEFLGTIRAEYVGAALDVIRQAGVSLE